MKKLAIDEQWRKPYFLMVRVEGSIMPETQTDVLVVSLTESAAAHVKHLLANDPENAGKTLRIFVESGGCSGMQYGMVFDEPRADDTSAEYYGVNLLVDPISAEYLRGTVVDYVDALTGGGFKIVNPKARQSCGCGKSFEA